MTTKFSGKVILPNTIPTTALSGSVVSASYAATASFTTLPAGIVSSSTQVQPLLPGGTISSSTQLPGGTISSSTQLPAGTVSSSAQYPGWVTASSQIDYNSITNKLSGVVSSSTQVQPLLPGGTVSSSAQYPGWVTASSQVVWSSVNYNSGIVSSSTQVQADLPGGTVSSSAQYPGWITASSQVVWSSVNYNSGIVSSSTQFNALVGTSASFATTANAVNGGSANYIPLWTSATAVSSSNIYQLTGDIGIYNTVPSASLHVSGPVMFETIINKAIVTGSAPPATFNVDINSGSIFFRSASAGANWTLNFRGDAANTLNSTMYNGQSMDVSVLVFNGATPRSASAYQIDGATVTPRWTGGTSGSGNANGLDLHQFKIIKIFSASYYLLGSITKYT